MEVAGVDGCRGGWVVVRVAVDAGPPWTGRVGRVGTLDGVVAEARAGALAVVGVDMPMGLPVDGPRASDRLLRARLGVRRSSVFPTPPRAALGATDFADALARARAATGRGISLQAFHLLAKIRELDGLIDPGLQERVVEVHPESSFAALAGAPLASTKRRAAGRAERRALLVPWFAGVAERADDDELDAHGAAWTAARVALGTADWVGDPEERDARGMRMLVAV